MLHNGYIMFVFHHFFSFGVKASLMFLDSKFRHKKQLKPTCEYGFKVEENILLILYSIVSQKVFYIRK